MTQSAQHETATQPAPAAPRMLGRHEFDAAAGALARAFHDDPLIGYFFPDEAQRTKIGPLFFRGALRLAHPEGSTYTTGETPLGGALWMPPGKSKVPMGRLLRVMIPDLPRYGLRGARRLLAVVDELEKKHPKQPHWYLMVLGVEPARQGQGLGGVLMSEVLARADAERSDAYLETNKAVNVPFYERHGFEVVENFNCHRGKGPETWTMLRRPRA